MGFVMKYMAQKSANQQKTLELAIAGEKAVRDSQDAAAKRGSPWVRKFIAVTVILICFGSLLLAPILDVPVTILRDIPQHNILWGLIKWGKGFELVSSSGVFMPPYAIYAVHAILGYFFGSGMVKTK